MDRIIRMVMNMLIRKVVNRGVNAGVDLATRGREDTSTTEQQASTQSTTRNARKLMRTARRFTRF
ncbi:MAG: hypothetical protein ACI8TF_002331 [Paracoccaceae bacterium]|jgi:hypothetical protein